MTGKGSGQHFLSTLGLNEDSRKMISLLVHSSNDSAQGSSTARHQMAPSCTSQKAHRFTMTNSLPRKLQSTVEGSGSLGPGRLHQALATRAEMRMQQSPCSRQGRGGEGILPFAAGLQTKVKSPECDCCLYVPHTVQA